MENYLNWLEYAGDIFAISCLVCVALLRGGPSAGTKLLAHITGGLALCAFAGAFGISPYSPKPTVTGRVVEFHQAGGYRHEWFEFRIDDGVRVSPVLKANYFDRGYYFGDPAVSDGNIASVTYLDWTRDVTRISMRSGAHPGWIFDRDVSPGPFLLLVFSCGLVLMLRGIFIAIADRSTSASDRKPETKDFDSTSILKL